MKLLSIVLLLPLVGFTQAPSQPEGDWDEQLLKSAGISTASDDLLSFFRKRTPTEADHTKLQEAIKKLASSVYTVREMGKKDLESAGVLALPYLTQALRSSKEGDTAEIVQQLIKQIESQVSPEQPIAAARVLAKRQAPGAAQVLVDYLPHAGDAWTKDEVLVSLGRIVVRPGYVDPVLLTALKDKLPERRSAAVYLLARRGDFEQRDTIRRFLGDPDPAIRANAIQGLVGKQALEILKETAASDQALLKSNNITPDEASLLAELSRRSLTEAKQSDIRQFIRQLGADSFRDRQLAHKKLIQEGTPALVFLREAQTSADLEVRRRVDQVLEEIRRGPGPALPIAIARLLAQPREKGHLPAAAIRVLLEYVPFADDFSVEEEVLNCLCLLSVRDEKVDPLFTSALQDNSAARRAAAAYVLGKTGTREQVVLVRKLLDDAVPSVRLRAAQGLLAARDKTLLAARDKHGTPRLVSLLADLEPPALWQAEDLLHRLAVAKSPPDPVGETSLESRQKAARAWEKWWDANVSTLDLAQADETDPRLGLTIVCEYDEGIGKQGGGQVWEMGPDRKSRWKITGLLGPMEAQMLPSGRVLIAENSSRNDGNSGTVTERDLSGNVRWVYELKGGNPITAQRLPNGNTFIATYSQLMEVTPAGKTVYSHTRGPNFYIFSAQKLRNGNIVCATAAGDIVELESTTGKELRKVSIGNNGGWCSVEVQPNGRYLVATLVGQGQVREIDIHGKVHMSFNFPGVFRATRLPNGNFLVASMTTRKVAEFDRNGVQRWEHVCEGRPWSVRYR